MKLNLSIKEITLVGMCTALMAIFSQLSIPLPFTSVPVTLQVFGLVILSIIVGGKIGTFSLIVYVIIGAIGLPVFANFHSGFGVLVGPTGGYIAGFVIMAFLIGYTSSKENKVLLFVVSYIGVLIDLVLGTIQLKIVTGMTINAALIAGLYPFILKDLIIVSIAVIIGLRVKKSVAGILPQNAAS